MIHFVNDDRGNFLLVTHFSVNLFKREEKLWERCLHSPAKLLFGDLVLSVHCFIAVPREYFMEVERKVGSDGCVRMFKKRFEIPDALPGSKVKIYYFPWKKTHHDW